MDFPTAPVFTLSNMGDTGYKNISTSFFLINQNENWLNKNFQFLHALFAGTSWVQLENGFIRGSNVYNVYVPGRFNILWAAMGATITTVR